MGLELSALELSQNDQPIWYVLAEAEIYGPYSERQMFNFIEEGLLTPESRVMAGEGGHLVRAGELALFRPGFGLDPEYKGAKGLAANFMIMTQLEDETMPLFVQELERAGVYSEPIRGTFCLRSKLSATDLRVLFDRLIAPSEQVIVVDATRNRLAWTNLGAETDTRIRSIWNSDI